MSDAWQSYVRRIEELAARSGLAFHPVDFEAVPDSWMRAIAVYGLPVRRPHGSVGVRYIYQLIQRHMGHSRLFEVVFPGNPGHAYLAESNGLAENILVTAHVLGHADFARNNLLFRRCQEQVSEHIVEHAANHARQIQQAIETHGAQRVEAALDAALALEQHIDIDQQLRRARYPEYLADPRTHLDAIKCHSDVVRPVAAEQQVALSINPYHLGFAMWEKIVESKGLAAARAIMEQDDDFGFVRNHLTRELADELGLFRFSARS